MALTYTTLTIFLLFTFTFCCENIEHEVDREAYKNINVVLDLEDSTKELQFSEFLNGLYGSSIGPAILVSCDKPYNPEANAHEVFVAQFQKVVTSTTTVISAKKYPVITGATCDYSKEDPKTVYTSAKAARADVATLATIKELLYKTTLGKSIYEFSNCIGADNLNKIAPADYVKEALDILKSDSKMTKLFESFCSINNIFSFTKDSIDSGDKNLFSIMGKRVHDILIAVTDHYNNMK
jgi:hypothetical protein